MFCRFACLWWAATVSLHVLLMWRLITLYPCVQQLPSMYKFLSNAAFFFAVSTSFLYSGVYIAFILSLLAISRLIITASLNFFRGWAGVAHQCFNRLRNICNDVLVGVCGQGKVFEGPTNFLHLIFQMEAGIPACGLGFFYQFILFLRKHLFEDNSILVCRTFFAPFLERLEVYTCIFYRMICLMDYVCRG